MEKKIFNIEDFSIKKEDGKIYIEGYANTKNKPDRYGDIPKGDNVYDIKEYKKNPVVFIDHYASAAYIAGNMVNLKEDEKGLKFKMLLRQLDDIHNPPVKDAVSAYITGFARALSIGGRWFFDDEKNPKHLTKAIIHEISIVGVGADPNALANTPKPKKLEAEAIKEAEADKIAKLEAQYGKGKVYRLTKKIQEIRKNVNNK